MRTTIGQTWVMQLMIVFILLFVAYIVLILNYSRTIKVKNEMITLIEKYEGLNDYSIESINGYLNSNGYVATGVCVTKEAEGVYGGTVDSVKLEKAKAGKKYSYCLKKYQGTSITNYYQVALFYKFNLPVLGNVSGFTVKGTTNNFKSFDDDLYCNNITGTCNSSSSRPSTDTGESMYTVTFNLNGGYGSIPSQQVRTGGTVRMPANPTMAGHTFNCWGYYNNGRLTTFDVNTRVDRDLELVAIWK